MGRRLILFFALLAVVSVCHADVVWNPTFGTDPLWNDGNAEVAAYDARDVLYGVPRASLAVLIVVAEDLSPEKLVKADAPQPGKSVRVLKLNHVRSIGTGMYAYEQMLSAFLDAAALRPVKISMASHDWCGNTFVEWRRDRNVLSVRSYFDAIGDRDVPFGPGDAVFYDALPLKLRALDFARTRSGTIRLIETLFTIRPQISRAAEARLEVRTAGDRYRVEITRGPKRDALEFERGYPHRLVLWKRADGGILTLRSARRIRYWEKNRPGDERILDRDARNRAVSSGMSDLTRFAAPPGTLSGIRGDSPPLGLRIAPD
ncbi:MAG: hypothetical protein ABR576_03965 [Thermoanaerobaculia bacterium]